MLFVGLVTILTGRLMGISRFPRIEWRVTDRYYLHEGRLASAALAASSVWVLWTDVEPMLEDWLMIGLAFGYPSFCLPVATLALGLHWLFARDRLAWTAALGPAEIPGVRFCVVWVSTCVLCVCALTALAWLCLLSYLWLLLPSSIVH
jgi:hypothetical protein